MAEHWTGTPRARKLDRDTKRWTLDRDTNDNGQGQHQGLDTGQGHKGVDTGQGHHQGWTLTLDRDIKGWALVRDTTKDWTLDRETKKTGKCRERATKAKEWTPTIELRTLLGQPDIFTRSNNSNSVY